MKIGIVGSRNIVNYKAVKQSLDEIVKDGDIIVSGGAIGVDSLAEDYADYRKLDKEIYKPEWDKYGKVAGLIRNSKIVESSDYIVAFWDGKSTGTLDTIKKAEAIGKQVIKIIM